jgi:hypothetical protein
MYCAVLYCHVLPASKLIYSTSLFSVPVESSRRGPLPLLHAIFTHFDIDPLRVEKIPSKPRNPAQRDNIPFRISILPRASVEDARTANEETKVDSDGSSINGKVGAGRAAAVLTA